MTPMSRLLSLVPALALALTGCGGNAPKPAGPPASEARQAGPLVDDRYTLEGDLETAPSSVSGTGRLLFQRPIKDIDSHFRLEFTLADKTRADWGTVTLIAYADAGLKKGVNISFTRMGRERLAVQVNNVDQSKDFITAGIGPQGKIQVGIDVHNSHDHYIVWVGNKRFDLGGPGRGTGRFWGVILDKAELSAAVNFPAQDNK